MARRATWIVILALFVMPMLGPGVGQSAFAQDVTTDETPAVLDQETPVDDETVVDDETPVTDGEATPTEAVEPSPTETETATPTDVASPTEGTTPIEEPSETAVPTETEEVPATPVETVAPTTEAPATATIKPTTAGTKTSTPKASSTPDKVKAADVKPTLAKSDITVTINCTSSPERIRVINNGDAPLIVQTIGSIFEPLKSEPITVNKKINGGKSYEWFAGPTASGNNTLINQHILRDSAYDQEGVIVKTNVGTLSKRCPKNPPTALSQIKLSINCTSDPEKIRFTNNGSQTITVYSISTLYSRLSTEPFSVRKTIAAGGSRSWEAGAGASGNYVLTKSFILSNAAYDNEGVQVITSSGILTARCPKKPADPFGGAKWIEVNLSTQYLIAWQNGVRVNETYVSTGRPGFDTPVGTWYVNTKLTSQTMSGCIQGECYYVPDVPWVMYFTDWGHALHGAYWHNNFGQVMSHGCVNLPVSFAEWLYYWTPYGTPVVVHY